MNLSSRINNPIASNPYSVNGQSPCMPEWRRTAPRASAQVGVSMDSPTKPSPTAATAPTKTLRLRDDLGASAASGGFSNRNAGNAILGNLRSHVDQAAPTPNKPSKSKSSMNSWPALLHKGRVLSVSKEAYLNVVTKFTNSLMRGGKQQKAEGILRRCRMFIKIKGKKTSKSSYQAVQNVKPLVELKNQQKSKGSRRKQKSTPAPISPKRGVKLAIQ
jgi:hypothetical protein